MIQRSSLKRYAPNVIHPVGGKVDPHENPANAAQREVFEETGLRTKNMRLEAVLFELSPNKDSLENWLIFHFSADYSSGKLKRTEEGTLRWMTEQEIKKAKLFPSVHPFIKDILNPQKGPVFATIKWNEDRKSITGYSVIQTTR